MAVVFGTLDASESRVRKVELKSGEMLVVEGQTSLLGRR